MSNVKQGDWAVIVGCTWGSERAVGHICKIIEKEPHPITGALGWHHSPAVPGTDWDCTLDMFLRPIRDQPGNESWFTAAPKSLPATTKGDTITERGELA